MPCISIDREEAMLEVAAVRAEGLANVELRRGQLDAIPLPDAAFDPAALGPGLFVGVLSYKFP